jgi:hypothetical protein
MSPSPEDDEITLRLRAAADVLGLYFLDHVIFSETKFFSYRQSGELDKDRLSPNRQENRWFEENLHGLGASPGWG